MERILQNQYKKIDIQINNPFFEVDYLKIDFEWFTACDRDCSYCYNVAGGAKRYTKSTEYIKKILLKIMTMDCSKIIISLLGGEILLSPDFNEIMEFIDEHRKPEHKFLLFTHGQHSPEFFVKKMKSAVPLNGAVRIVQSIHFEDMKFKNFEENAKYIEENFSSKSFVVFPDQNLRDNLDWFTKLINDNRSTSIEPLTYDFTDDKISVLKHQVNINQLKELLDPFKARSEMQYNINNKTYYGIEAKHKVHTDYGYKFKGLNCVLRVYEIRENGDMYSSCAGTLGLITNIKYCTMEELNDKIKVQTIKCPFDRCEPNLCALKVYN